MITKDYKILQIIVLGQKTFFHNTKVKSYTSRTSSREKLRQIYHQEPTQFNLNPNQTDI